VRQQARRFPGAALTGSAFMKKAETEASGRNRNKLYAIAPFSPFGKNPPWFCPPK
jgi:hypothetical protein